MKINLQSSNSLHCLSKSIIFRIILFASLILGTQANAQSVSIASNAADDTICAGTAVTFTATPADEGAVVSYQWYIGLATAGTDSDTFTTSDLTNGQTVSVVMTSDDVDYTSNTITTTVIELSNAGTNGTLTICAGTTPTETQLFDQLGGTPDAGGTWSNVGLVYTYTVAANAPCVTDATATITVTEQAAPNAGSNGTLTVCAGTTPTPSELFAELGGTPDTGGTWSNVGLIYTYTVVATNPCTTNATATVTVTEQAAPDAGTNGTLTICAGTTPDETELFAQLGGTPDTGGTWSHVGLIYTYTVSASTPCSGTDTATVTVTEQATPDAGTNGTLTICAGTTPSDAELFAQLGGTPDVGGTWTNTDLVYTYTVTATTPCATDATATVTVTEQATPDAGTNGALTICAGTTPDETELFAQLGGTPDTGGTWSHVGLVYTYTVSATTPCSGTDTATVTVTEQAAPDAGTNGTLTICAGTTPSDAELFAQLGGTPDTGGTWSNADLVYTYTVTATAPCATDATATVTVTEQAVPNAGNDGELLICAGTTPSDAELFAQLGGTPDTGGNWSNIGLVYTYTVVATNPCTTNATATVTVTEQAAPDAGTNGTLTICAGATPDETELFAQLGGTPDTGGIWSNVGLVYTYTVSATTPCSGTDTATVTVTEQAAPDAGTDGELTICAGTTPSDAELFAQLGGTPDVGGTWTNADLVYTYTVTATAPCATDATATITVTEQAAPNAGNDGELLICAGVTPSDAELFAQLGGTPDETGTWSNVGLIYTYTVSAITPCSETDTATVTVTEQAAPNAGTNGTLTICSGSTPTESELFAQLGGTPDEGGTWSNVGLVYTYTVDPIEPCVDAATATVTVTERAADAGIISGVNGTDYFDTSLSACSGTNEISLTLINTFGNIQWMYAVSATGTYRTIWGQTSNTLVLPENITGNQTTYYFAKVSCSTDVYTNKIAVSILKSIPGTITGAGEVCSGGSKTLTLGAHAGTVQWQTSSTDSLNDSDWTNVGVVNSSTYTTPALSATTYYRVKVVNSSCDSATSPSVAVTISQSALSGTLSGTNTLCYGNGTNLEVTGTSGSITWQKSTNYVTTPLAATWTKVNNTSSTPISTDGSGGSILGTGNLKVSTAYRVMTTSGSCVTYSESPFVVTVTPLAKAGVVTTPTATVCLNGAITFSLTGSVGTSYQWQSSATRSTAVGSIWNDVGTAATYDTTASSLASLNIRCVVTNSCNSSTSVVKTIVVNKPSVAGTITGGGTVCSSSTSTLRLAGYTGAIQWEFSTDGVNFATAPYLKSGGIYMNPSNATTFETTNSSGNGATYNITNVTANTYIRARVTNGQCSSVYSSPVLYENGTEAIVGTISALNSSICYGTATTLTLAGSTGTIVWQKSTDYLTLSDSSLATWSNLTSTNSNVSTGKLLVSTAYRAKVTIGSCSVLYSTVYTVTVENKALAKSITKSVSSPSGNSALTQLCTNFTTIKTLTVGTGYVGAISWQHSVDNINWTTIEGETSASYTIDVASDGANYYRAKFSVASCTQVAYSSSVVVYYKSCSARFGNLGIDTEAQVSSNSDFSVIAYPNPSSNVFTIQVQSSSKGVKTGIQVYDTTGRLLENRDVNSDSITLGSNYPSGIYQVIVKQGANTKTVRVIKR
jgi:hypothetical protein